MGGEGVAEGGGGGIMLSGSMQTAISQRCRICPAQVHPSNIYFFFAQGEALAYEEDVLDENVIFMREMLDDEAERTMPPPRHRRPPPLRLPTGPDAEVMEDPGAYSAASTPPSWRLSGSSSPILLTSPTRSSCAPPWLCC